jgi:hypothetical protein
MQCNRCKACNWMVLALCDATKTAAKNSGTRSAAADRRWPIQLALPTSIGLPSKGWSDAIVDASEVVEATRAGSTAAPSRLAGADERLPPTSGAEQRSTSPWLAEAPVRRPMLPLRFRLMPAWPYRRSSGRCLAPNLRSQSSAVADPGYRPRLLPARLCRGHMYSTLLAGLA